MTLKTKLRGQNRTGACAAKQQLRESENKCTTVVRIDNLGSNAPQAIAAPVSMTGIGKSKSPNVIVVDQEYRIYEPGGEDNILQPTSDRIVIEGIDAPTAAVGSSTTLSIDRLRDYMSYMPAHFVGRSVFKHFEATSQTAAGVFKGTVGAFDDQAGRPGHHLWQISYPDGHTEDFDHEDMDKWGIQQQDGSAPTGGGLLLRPRSTETARRPRFRSAG